MINRLTADQVLVAPTQMKSDHSRLTGIDTVHHEGGDSAGGVVLGGIAAALQVIEDLLVNVTEVLPLGEIVEIHFVNRHPQTHRARLCGDHSACPLPAAS